MNRKSGTATGVMATVVALALGLWGIFVAAVPGQQTEENEMSTGIEIVEAFVEAFNAQDVDAIMEFFTEDAVYHNMPGPPVQGTDAVRRVIESYVSTADSMDWEILKSAETGDTVLNERIDRFVIGGKPVVLPVMGAFDLRDGKIAAWRDYFDMATWQRQMTG